MRSREFQGEKLCAHLSRFLVPHAEAQEELGTIEQRLVKFRDQVVAMSKNAAETAKAMGKKAAETAKVKLEKIKNSEIATNSR